MHGTYRDSVFLMQLSREAARRSGAERVFAVMASPRNKELFARSGLLTPEIEAAGPDDLAVAIEARAELRDKAAATVRAMLDKPHPAHEGAARDTAPRSLEEACERRPGSDLALISVAGEYARYEAAKALAAGLDVMLYSGNISLEAELALKRLAFLKNLLLMGPDCGTAIINRVPLGIANSVRHGAVGIVASSGTGIQETACLLDRVGLGVSNAYGTGGRDFLDEIGGISAQTAITRLVRDERTRIILVIGKTPGLATREKLADMCAALAKPVIMYYLGVSDTDIERAKGIECASSLTDLALRAAKRLAPVLDTSDLHLPARELPEKPLPKGFLRGIFSGGAFCREAAAIAGPLLEGEKYSNLPLPGFSRTMDAARGNGHVFLDLGLDEFTVGRPHPLLSPDVKLERLVVELCDPLVSVLLTDIVLGFGGSPNQAPLLVQALDRAALLSGGKSRDKKIVLSVCGTESDEPSRSSQISLLQEAGILVLGNNAQAAEYAAKLASGQARSKGPKGKAKRKAGEQAYQEAGPHTPNIL